MPDRRKTSIYLGEEEDARIEKLKRALRTDADAVAIRYAILNVPLPTNG